MTRWYGLGSSAHRIELRTAEALYRIPTSTHLYSTNSTELLLVAIEPLLINEIWV